MPTKGFPKENVDLTEKQTYFDKVQDRISAFEKKFSTILDLGEVLDYAAQRPAELGVKGTIRGHGDALRHLLLAAELHRTAPAIADTLLVGHEVRGSLLGSQSMEELQQDIHNNRLGKEIAKKSTSRQQTEILALLALPKAKLASNPED